MSHAMSPTRTVHVDRHLDDLHAFRSRTINQRRPLLSLIMVLVIFASWVLAPSAALAEEQTQQTLTATVNYSRVNLREGPGTNFRIVDRLSGGEQVSLLARRADWFRVRTSDSVEGWVFGELLDTPAEAANLADDQPQATTEAYSGNDVVAFAMQFNGAPYVWGGEGPYAFDCSGFTKYVYGHFGVQLPHNAAAQFNSAYGEIIYGTDNLQPGDIVFFVNTYKRGISHVGLYIGDGQVLQAMSPRQGVAIAPLSSPYWGPRYYAALRPYR